MALRNYVVGGVAALVVLAAAGAAEAHHSAAMFDRDKTLTLNATVKSWTWSNPHAWLLIVAPGPGGSTTEWNLEGSSINILARKGWSIKSFKPGDKVDVSMHPMRDGTASGMILTVKTGEGHVLADHDY